MAQRPLNSLAGFSTGDPAITVIQANGDITTINLTANGLSNLGIISNVTITGGSNGQSILTDGNGNLSFGNVRNIAPMPIIIYDGDTEVIPANYQGLFGVPLEIDGTLEVDGVLVDVSGQGTGGTDTQVIFNDDGAQAGNNGFTFTKQTGNLHVPGAIITANGANFTGQVNLGPVGNINIGGGISGYFLQTNGEGGLTWNEVGSGQGIVGYQEANNNVTATANTIYIVNTNMSNITITLPQNVNFGTQIGVIDGTGNASLNSITIDRNGGNIQGTANNLTVNTNRAAFTLVYYNATQGWILTNV